MLSVLPRIGLLVIAALVALGLRFFWLTAEQISSVVLHGAYWLLLASATAFCWFLYSENFFRAAWTWLRQQRWMLAVLAALCAVSLIHERFMFKINYDEHVLLSISRSMHYEHLSGWQADGKLYFGSVTGVTYVPDKRPVFYPFVLSLFHSATGYRTENAFILNGLVAALCVLCVYRLGAGLGGRMAGFMFGALLVGVPLFGQNATSGGFDLLNMTLIALLANGVCSYFKTPSPRNLTMISFVAVFLANTRYESLLYALVPYVCYLINCIRSRELARLPWLMVLLPLGLIPALFSNGVFNSSEAFFQTTRDEFWNVKNYIPNLEHAVAYLFDPDRGGTNSILLAAVGAVSMVFLPIVIRRELLGSEKPIPAGALSLLVVGAVLIANVVLTLGLGWGKWDDPLVSRFTLPFWFILAWSVMRVIASMSPGKAEASFKGGALIAGLWLVVFSAGDASAARETNKLGPAFLLARSIEFLKEYDPWRKTLVVGGSALPYLNEGFPATSVESGAKVVKVVNHRLYENVVVVLHYKRNSTDGSWMGDATMAAFEGAKFQTLKEFHLDPFNRIVIAKVVSVPDEKTPKWIPSTDDESPDAYARRVYQMLP